MRTVKRKWFIGILVLGFLGSLSFALYQRFGPFDRVDRPDGTIADIPQNFDYGAVSDSVYCNDLFGFRIPIPLRHTADYKRFDYIETDAYERDSIPAVPKPISEIKDHNLLIIEPEFKEVDVIAFFKETGTVPDISTYLKQKNQREMFGPQYQMAIRVHQLSGKTLNAYSNLFQNLHHPDYGNPKTKTISGVIFQERHGIEQNGSDSPGRVMFRMLGGKNRHIIAFTTEIHGFALSIDLFYHTEEQKHELMNMVETMTFH